MTHIDNEAVAARLRALIGSRSLKDAAAQLGVSEAALCCSLDPAAPFPTVDVLVGAALFFAVDPTWILTGNYDTSTHHVVLDGETGEVARSIQRILADNIVPVRAQMPARALEDVATVGRETSSA